MNELIYELQDRLSPSEIVELLNSIFRHHKRSVQILEEFALSNNICPKCACELEVHTWLEPRGEHFGYPTKEYISELRCPNCNEVY